MKWHIKDGFTSSHKFTDNNKNAWGYLTKSEMAGKYPNGGFRIVSDMHKKANTGIGNTIENGNSNVSLFPYNNKLKEDKVLGYIPVNEEEDSYVRIISTSLIKPVLLSCIVVVLLLLAFFIGMRLSKDGDSVPGLDKAAVSYQIEGLRNDDPNQIALPGISIIKMKENTNAVEYPLQNPVGNQCYMKYIIRDKATKDIIYESGLIEPGKAITEFTLKKTYPKGEHQILVEVQTFSIKDHKVPLNGGSMEAVLRVE